MVALLFLRVGRIDAKMTWLRHSCVMHRNYYQQTRPLWLSVAVCITVTGNAETMTIKKLTRPDAACAKHALALASVSLMAAACGGGSDVTTIDAAVTPTPTAAPAATRYFNRIASFPVCRQIEDNCNDATETSAEIVAATTDGNTLIYTDSPAKKIGLVDITDAKKPQKITAFDVGGEPTSVYVKGKYALVGVNTSVSYTAPSGTLKVVDISDVKAPKEVAAIDLGGQPDSVAVSPDGKYAAVAIENERDESLGDGGLPQLPPGKLVVVDTSDASPSRWSSQDVTLTGLNGMLENTDPEPEYVDFNSRNEILVTMQENNHIAIVDAAKAKVTAHFSAGKVTLNDVDATEEKPRLIRLTETLKDVPREPDGATWINDDYFATANEGDWKGGSRGFSVFHKNGTLAYDSGNTLDHMAVRLGHYPEKRSANKGNEPENAEFGQYGSDALLFVASERASVVFVYDVKDPTSPKYKQTLPAGVAPEGVLAIPGRNLLIAASEKDSRKKKMRSTLNIYEYQTVDTPAYPALKSADVGGKPIAWGALSGLAAGNSELYAVHDSFYGRNSIFTINTDTSPAIITRATAITDTGDKLASLKTVTVKAGEKEDSKSRRSVFDNLDLSALINSDKTVNIDPEGIAVASGGGFWLVSEGAGTLSNAKKRPLNSLNMVLKIDSSGSITAVYTLPEAVNAKQIRFGFEGVAEYAGKVYVAFQRAWEGETNPRIGILNPTDGTWEFVYYTLDKPESQNGGWVGLSDIASLGDGRFAVLERDNQGGPDAAIKRIYEIDLSNAQNGDTVTKTLKRDLIATGDLTKTGGMVPEKTEGLAVDAAGNYWVVNDNDGVDDNSGETQLLKLGKL